MYLSGRTQPRGGGNIHVSLRGVLTQKQGVIFIYRYLSGVFSHRKGGIIHVSLRGVLTQKEGVIFMYLSGAYPHRRRG
jgi:hypothetical protein